MAPHLLRVAPAEVWLFVGSVALPALRLRSAPAPCDSAGILRYGMCYKVLGTVMTNFRNPFA